MINQPGNQKKVNAPVTYCAIPRFQQLPINILQLWRDFDQLFFQFLSIEDYLIQFEIIPKHFKQILVQNLTGPLQNPRLCCV